MLTSKSILKLSLWGLLVCSVGLAAETEPVKKATKAEVEAALSQGFEWYAYSVELPKRFKYFGEVNYVPAKEGYFYKGVVVNNILYLQNPEGIILEPHFEIENDFSTRVQPVKKYFDNLNKKIENLKKQLEKENGKLKEASDTLSSLKKTQKNDSTKKNKKNKKQITNEEKNLKNKISNAEKKKKTCQDSVNKTNDEYMQIKKRFKDLNTEFTKLSKETTIAP